MPPRPARLRTAAEWLPSDANGRRLRALLLPPPHLTRDAACSAAPCSSLAWPRRGRLLAAYLAPLTVPFTTRPLVAYSFWSLFLYSSYDACHTWTVPGAPLVPLLTTHSSSATISMRRSSWETNTTPPSKWLRAIARASIVSRSRWLVGSSSSKMCGERHASSAKARRDFWPPERNLMGLSARSPERPKRPRYLRASSTETPSEVRSRMWLTELFSGSIISMWCCVNLATISLACRPTWPSVGWISPVSSRRNVDLPAPSAILGMGACHIRNGCTPC
mmetsp:Transcript_73555/g.202047  ORF Transcript_73555/g.202047 Transcript_73555/m.202047 type:complete len:277 (-) Transcript_73555:634-1464(-)